MCLNILKLFQLFLIPFRDLEDFLRVVITSSTSSDRDSTDRFREAISDLHPLSSLPDTFVLEVELGSLDVEVEFSQVIIDV